MVTTPSRRAFLIPLMMASAAGCPAPRPVAMVIAPPAELATIARLEAERVAVAPRLRPFVAATDPLIRRRALRALGRVGDAEAIAALRAALATADEGDRAAAAEALGIAAALGGELLEATPDLLAALAATADPVARAAIVCALGRAGDARSLPALTAALAAGDEQAAAAGVALGRFGRRALAIDDGARAALITASRAAAAPVRYAATYGLGREQRVTGADHDVAVERALAARLVSSEESDVPTRAAAAAALGKRKAFGGGQLDALADSDWRVAVEAVRALAASQGATAATAIATAAVRAWTEALNGSLSAVHVVTEALRALLAMEIATEARAGLDGVLARLSEGIGGTPPALALAAGTVDCLLAAVRTRTRSDGVAWSRWGCGGAENVGLSAHLRQQIVAEAVAAGAGGIAEVRRETIAALAADGDPRVHGAALDAAGAMLAAQPGPELRAFVIALVEAGLTDRSPEVAGSAAALAATLLAPPPAASPAALAPPMPPPAGDIVASVDEETSTLQQLLLAAATAAAAADPELRADLLAALAEAHLAAGAPLCRAAHADANPAVAQAGRACLTALEGQDPGPGLGAAPALPPVDPAPLLGRGVRWILETSRGRITIALEPDRAPWHVASIVALTRQRFYDGLLWHRVVPDFVVQGGDPSGSGWGGPGYTLPAEPSDLPYSTGTVGIADAGKDTGGSQFFLMHGPAPHLDARYTAVGRVLDGQAAADALLVGDRIVSASIVLE